MSKCIIVADKDPGVAAVVAHLMTSIFDTGIVKDRLKKDLAFYVSGEPCLTNALAAEIVGSPVGDLQAPTDVLAENVVAVVTVCGFNDDDQLVRKLVASNAPVLRLGEFHPKKVDFRNFNEDIADQTLALALADASVGFCNFLISSIAVSI